MKRHMRMITNDQGSALVIGLLTLALLSLLGSAATTTSRTESQIAGNDKVHKEAFYATEIGLTKGEMVVENLATRYDLDEENIKGHYGQGEQPAWSDLEWNDDYSVAVNSADIPTGLAHIAAAPRYTIEERDFRRDSLTTGIGVPTGVYRFNVSAHGNGSTSKAETLLQTIYAKRYN